MADSRTGVGNVQSKSGASCRGGKKGSEQKKKEEEEEEEKEKEKKKNHSEWWRYIKGTQGLGGIMLSEVSQIEKDK